MKCPYNPIPTSVAMNEIHQAPPKNACAAVESPIPISTVVIVDLSMSEFSHSPGGQ